MPATFTRHTVETERKDPGIGGKPPVDRRPTGGGGGDENWDSRHSRRHGPREQLIRYRMAVFSDSGRRSGVLRGAGERVLCAAEFGSHLRRATTWFRTGIR